jgi:hypothetical protein
MDPVIDDAVFDHGADVAPPCTDPGHHLHNEDEDKIGKKVHHCRVEQDDQEVLAENDFHHLFYPQHEKPKSVDNGPLFRYGGFTDPEIRPEADALPLVFKTPEGEKFPAGFFSEKR